MAQTDGAAASVPSVILHVTGFGRFRGVEDNPSASLVRSLPVGTPLADGAAVISDVAVVEVSAAAADEALATIRDQVAVPPPPPSSSSSSSSPLHHVLLHFGVAAGAPCFFLEQQAFNDKSFRIPDERGYQPREEPIDVSEGAIGTTRATDLPTEALAAALAARGHAVQASKDPGRFLCNYIYYRSQQTASQLTAAAAAAGGAAFSPRGVVHPLFVHVPSADVADTAAQTRFALDLIEEITAVLTRGPAREGAVASASSSASALDLDEAILAAKSGLVHGGGAAAGGAGGSASLRGTERAAPAPSPAPSSLPPLWTSLEALGFSANACAAAVRAMGPHAPVEEAVEWVLSHPEADAEPASAPSPSPSPAPAPSPLASLLSGLTFALGGPAGAGGGSGGSGSPAAPHQVFTRLKMVIVVRSDLEMTKGKIAAQACHVALKCVRQLNKRADYRPLVASWEAHGEPIVILRGEGLGHLQALKAAADEAGVPAYFIHDAGRTQVEPGTATVLGLGPAEETRIDSVTGSLKLL
jgi:peptidyl-tRNA hydrolase